MDDNATIISIKDSDSAYSFATLIEDETTGKKETSILNQSQVCHLFVNHFKEGVTSHMAKKLYVAGLKEKPTDSPTVVFEKKENKNDEKENNLDKKSMKRRSTSDVPVLEKRKCDVKVETKETESSRLTKRSNTTYPDAKANQLKNTCIVTKIQAVTATTSNRSVLNVSQAPPRTSSPKRPPAIPPSSNGRPLKRPSTLHERHSSPAKRPNNSHERSSTSHRRPSESSKRSHPSKQPSSSHHGTSHPKVEINLLSKHSKALVNEVEGTPTPEFTIPKNVLNVARNINISKREVDDLSSSMRNVCGNGTSLKEIDIFSGEPTTSPVTKIKSKWPPNIQIKKLKSSPKHDYNNNQHEPKTTVYRFNAPSTPTNESTRVKANNNQTADKIRTAPALSSKNEVAEAKTSTSNNERKPEVAKSKTTSHDDANKNEVKLLPGKSQIQVKCDYRSCPERIPKIILDRLSLSRKKQMLHDKDGSYGVWFRSDRRRCKIKKYGKEGSKNEKVHTSNGQDDSAPPTNSQAKNHIIRDLTCQRSIAQTRNFACQTDAPDTVNRLSEELKDKKIERNAEQIKIQRATIENQTAAIEEQNKRLKLHASTIECQERLIKKQAATIQEKENAIKTQSFAIEEKQKNIEEQGITIEDYKEKIQKQAFIIEANDKKIAEQVFKIEETNKSLQNKANELNQKNNEQERLSLQHEKIVEELKLKIKEQEQKLAETINNYELKLNEQEQKLIEQRDMIASQVAAIATISSDCTTLAISEQNCSHLLRIHREYCNENHVQKRKPRQPRRKSTLPPTHLTTPTQNPNMACGSQSVQQKSFQLTPTIQNLNMACGSQSVQQQSLNQAALSNHTQYSPLRLVNISKLTQNVPSINRSTSASHSSNSSLLQNCLTSPLNVPQPPSTTAVSTVTSNINVPVLIETPLNQWTVEATMPLLDEPNQAHQHNVMYSVIPSTSTSTSTQVNTPVLNYSQPQQQLFNGVASVASTSTAVHTNIPHHLLPRQPQRSTSMSSTKPNRFVTIMPQIQQGTSLYHPDSCSTQDDPSNQSTINSNENYQQQSQQFPSRLINRSQTLVYSDRRQYEQRLQDNIIKMRNERFQRTHNQLQRFQNQSHQLSHMQQSQEGQASIEGQLQDYKSVQQQARDRQPLFYCLACNKTANLVCKTCRNCCSCCDFCYTLLVAKHEKECTEPLMVPIKDILPNEKM